MTGSPYGNKSGNTVLIRRLKYRNVILVLCCHFGGAKIDCVYSREIHGHFDRHGRGGAFTRHTQDSSRVGTLGSTKQLCLFAMTASGRSRRRCNDYAAGFFTVCRRFRNIRNKRNGWHSKISQVCPWRTNFSTARFGR